MNRNKAFLAIAWFACALFAMRDVAAMEMEKRDVTIAVGGKATLCDLPLGLAKYLGYFKDEGLEFEINDFQSGSRSFQAMIGCSADVVVRALDQILPC